MQDDKLKYWYKESFEAIQGKPVPDVWDGVFAQLPERKAAWWPYSLLAMIPVAFLVFWFTYGPEYLNDYRELGKSEIAEKQSTYQNGRNSSQDDLNPNNPSRVAMLISSTKELKPSLKQNQVISDIKADKSTIGSKNKKETIPSLVDQQNWLDKSVSEKGETKDRQLVNAQDANLISNAIVNESKEPMAKAPLPSFTLVSGTSNHYQVQPVTQEINWTKPKLHYVGLTMNLSHVTMLNNSFLKALSSETNCNNALMIKPGFSVVAGKILKPGLIGELTVSTESLGQQITFNNSGLEEAEVTHLNYFSGGVNIIKPAMTGARVLPYVGATSRFRMLRESGNQTAELKKLDVAAGLMAGVQVAVGKSMTFSAGARSSLSLLNNAKQGGKIPAKFNRSRNLDSGLELKLTTSF